MSLRYNYTSVLLLRAEFINDNSLGVIAQDFLMYTYSFFIGVLIGLVSPAVPCLTLITRKNNCSYYNYKYKRSHEISLSYVDNKCLRFLGFIVAVI